MGSVVKNFQAPEERQKNGEHESFAPAGVWFVSVLLPTVSLWATFGRRSAAGNGLDSNCSRQKWLARNSVFFVKKIRMQFLITAIAVALVGCDQKTQINDSQSNATEKQAGMSEFEYLASDGGPHLVLPKELSGKWKGSSGLFFLISSKNDYARACAATANQLMALLPVGTGQAIVLGNPPLSAWGHSPEGWIDIYNLQAWADINTDALIKCAVTNTPTSGMKDTGKLIKLNQPGLILLFAGDKPGDTAYGEHDIPVDAGSYRILEGHYKPETNEEIFIYRLQPSKN